MPRRLIQLFAGLVLYGISDSMLLLAGLGVDPWDVLHQGLARRTGVPTGTWAIIVGAAVLAGCSVARSASAPWSTRPASARWPTSSCRCSAAPLPRPPLRNRMNLGIHCVLA